MMFIVYGRTKCPFCTNAVILLQSRGISYTYYSMDDRQEELLDLATQYGHKTVPIVMKVEDSNNIFIGGFDALLEHLGDTEKK